MIMMSLVLYVTLLLGVAEILASGKCPKKCFCDNSTKIAHCSKKLLHSLPETFPEAMTEANFNFNRFSNTVLTKQNMSLFTNLTNMYLGGCNIEHITEDTFVHMQRLQILDLSQNQLTVIQENTFRGLNLHHLFLYSNKMIVLTASSLEGLNTNGLHLHDCSLTSLPFNVFQPIQSSLTNLWLNDNYLSHIDVRFQPVFQKLNHLRLNGNPFKCDCELSWLKDFFESNPSKFNDVTPISCGSPSHLTTKSLNEVPRTNFDCKSPTFRNINAFFDLDQAVLQCSASGNPVPTLFWIQPNGKTIKYDPASIEAPASDGEPHDQIEAALRLQTTKHHHRHHHRPNASLESGMYICVANNKVGNVTLMVNVTWPLSHRLKSAHHHKKSHQTTNEVQNNSPPNTGNKSNGRRDKSFHPEVPESKHEDNKHYLDETHYDQNYISHNYHLVEREDISELAVGREGIFTLVEMVVAIIATHLLTIALVLCLMLVRNAILRSKRHKSRYVDEPQINSSGPLIGTNNRLPTNMINADPTYDKVGNVFTDVYSNSTVSNFPRLVNR